MFFDCPIHSPCVAFPLPEVVEVLLEPAEDQGVRVGDEDRLLALVLGRNVEGAGDGADDARDAVANVETVLEAGRGGSDGRARLLRKLGDVAADEVEDAGGGARPGDRLVLGRLEPAANVPVGALVRLGPRDGF